MDELKKALGLPATATFAEVQARMEAVLQEAMTPEEKAAEDEKKRKQEEEEEAKEEEMMAEALAPLSEALGLRERVTMAELIEAAKGVKATADAKLAETSEQGRQLAELKVEMRKLSDTVQELKPQAAKAEQLERDAKKATKDAFFAAQLSAGKLAPADREFWEAIWDTAQDKVLGYFKDKKPNSVVRLNEEHPEVTPDRTADEDPAIALNEHAHRIASEKKLGFVDALDEAKAAHPDLVAKMAERVGWPKR